MGEIDPAISMNKATELVIEAVTDERVGLDVGASQFELKDQRGLARGWQQRKRKRFRARESEPAHGDPITRDGILQDSLELAAVQEGLRSCERDVPEYEN